MTRPLQSVTHHFHSKQAKPSIIMGFGTADKALAYLAVLDHANITFIKEHLIEQLGKNGIDELKKMSPYELTKLAESTVDNFDQKGYILPGSTNTIPEFFWKEDAKIPKKLDIGSARSIFKMALSRKLSSENIASIYSCDGLNYPIALMGGKLEPSKTKSHYNGSHPLFVKDQPNWLYDQIKVRDPYKIKGDIMVSLTISTHPLTPKTLPKSAKVMAEAPDKVPSVIFLPHANAMGLLDHVEEHLGLELDSFETLDQIYKDYKNDQKKELHHATLISSTIIWDVILKNFLDTVSKAEEEKPSNSISPKKAVTFNPRIEEILETKNLTLSPQHFAVGR